MVRCMIDVMSLDLGNAANMKEYEAEPVYVVFMFLILFTFILATRAFDLFSVDSFTLP
jgi:hypothetical protein